ncbi:MAPEG family protein [Gimibacter soli]|uniref:MAPEG family protein n=1 Tax=Gimibacter soli TaxID=3024400 RepID=A0AAF0BNC5_9PROT|nr:MAPEG family protein [Gimibacter soli]WCL55801.1 MAPEG family protein [Gimibacter soli]
MTQLTITAAIASILALSLIPLSIQVGVKRLQTGIFFGEAGNSDLARRRAAQSNYVQYVPFFITLLAICELAGAATWLIASAGASMVLGRSLHAWCLLATNGTGNARAAGMILTFTSFALTGGYLGWWSMIAATN